MKYILDKIKEFNTIIIHGHIRPDGDCIGSQYGLMYLIKSSFPDKNVYVTGDSSESVSFLGRPSKIEDDLFEESLSICVDCATSNRLSDSRYSLSKYSIKIDHHVKDETYCDYEYIDETASSTTQIITEFYSKYKDELVMNKDCATALFTGLYTDTGRFQNTGVTSKAFKAASVLMEKDIDFKNIINNLNVEAEEMLKLKAYCLSNYKKTDNGFIYIVLTKEEINKFGISEEEASSIVTLISNVEGCCVWALIIETENNIRVRLRSRGPVINELASKYNGGGHKMASGATLLNWKELDSLVKDVDDLILIYKGV